MRYLVSRHQGATDWCSKNGICVDKRVTHLELQMIAAGDWVIGNLPINLVAQICLRGGRYWHLSMQLPESFRGQELSADQMNQFGARLEEFSVIKVQGEYSDGIDQ